MLDLIVKVLGILLEWITGRRGQHREILQKEMETIENWVSLVLEYDQERLSFIRGLITRRIDIFDISSYPQGQALPQLEKLRPKVKAITERYPELKVLVDRFDVDSETDTISDFIGIYLLSAAGIEEGPPLEELYSQASKAASERAEIAADIHGEILRLTHR
jgi:hypothetical protein